MTLPMEMLILLLVSESGNLTTTAAIMTMVTIHAVVLILLVMKMVAVHAVVLILLVITMVAVHAVVATLLVTLVFKTERNRQLRFSPKSTGHTSPVCSPDHIHRFRLRTNRSSGQRVNRLLRFVMCTGILINHLTMVVTLLR